MKEFLWGMKSLSLRNSFLVICFDIGNNMNLFVHSFSAEIIESYFLKDQNILEEVQDGLDILFSLEP